MGHLSELKKKIITADEAVKLVKSGDLVHYGEFSMNSRTLDAALARRKEELHAVNVRSVCCPFYPDVVKCDPERKHFVFDDWHLSRMERKIHTENLCNYIPLNYHESNSYFERRYVQPDVAFIMVAPPDRHGYVNFGPVNSTTRSICDRARTVIAEINNRVPYCFGGYDEAVHLSEIDWFVEGKNEPLPELNAFESTKITKQIANYVLNLIPNGACIQLGIGTIPSAVGYAVAASDLKDLGIHSEMLGDAIMEMYLAGKVSGSHKQIIRGKMVYTFAMGSQKLYKFLDKNPVCASYPASYTNSPDIIGQLDNFIAINTALEVDLYGQVSAESMGTRQISGTGGLLDFIEGAYKSNNGKGLICLPSIYTDGNGEIHSRIKPFLTPGTIVTVPRCVNSYVITEYGIAHLKGKSTWQRAEALINIAHPDFREELIRQADENHIWVQSNKRS